MSTVARVTQLDALQLDSEILNLFRDQLIEAVKYFQAGFLTSYEPEMILVLRSLIWKYSVLKTGGTLGQQMLNLGYRGQDHSEMTQIQRTFYGILTVLLPWIKERSSNYTDYARDYPFLRKIVKMVVLLDNILMIGSIANFLSFLQSGRYKNLLERILRIQTKYLHANSLREISFEYMNRALLWNGITEFLSVVSPLINLYQTKRFFNPILWNNTSKKLNAPESNVCAFCSELICNPHQAACGHLFCYYCVKARCLASSPVNCPHCGQQIRDDEVIFASCR